MQMLFGFLLAVPFTQRFARLSANQRALYYTAFVAAGAASVCFIAPASFHRIVWRHGEKQRLLDISSVLTVVGTVFLAVAITGVTLFVTSFLYGSGLAALVGGLLLAALVVLWYVVPVLLRLRAAR